MRRAQPWLGTIVEIEAWGNAEAAVMSAMDAAFAAVARVHHLMSRQQPGSDVQRINRAAVAERVPVDAWTAHVLSCARRISRASRGAFDVVTPRHAARSADFPKLRDLTLTRLRSGSHRWWVCKRRPCEISLDGIAKGFAVDQAVRVLRRRGIKAGLVNAGGDLRCFGDRPFRVAIRRPASRQPAPALTFDVRQRAVATSGKYFGARFWNKTSSGPRARASAVSVTIVASSAMLADALTKAALAAPGLAQRLLVRYRTRGWLVRNQRRESHWIALHSRAGKR